MQTIYAGRPKLQQTHLTLLHVRTLVCMCVSCVRRCLRVRVRAYIRVCMYVYTCMSTNSSQTALLLRVPSLTLFSMSTMRTIRTCAGNDGTFHYMQWCECVHLCHAHTHSHEYLFECRSIFGPPRLKRPPPAVARPSITPTCSGGGD